MDLFFKNIHIISPGDKLDLKTNLFIKNGVIVKIGNEDVDIDSAKIIEADGITCAPGFFDMHVHFRDPGFPAKENMTSGTLSALNGGFTGVLVMPNTEPPIDNPEIINYIKNKSVNSVMDIFISGCITKGRQGKYVSDFKELQDAGAIAFTDDGSAVQNPDIMEKVLKYSENSGVPVAQHCEDIYLSSGGSLNQGKTAGKMKLKGIPCISESSIIARDLLLKEFYRNSKYHIQHISCSGSLKLLQHAKMHSDNASAEVCPHYFILNEQDCLRFGTNAKMNPPLRTKEDIDAILRGIKDDIIDVISSDHAPHTDSEKSVSFARAPFGIIGLETSISLSYTYLVKNKIITFGKMIEMMSVNPRKILNLPQPRIRPGEKANLTLLKLDENWTIRKDNFKSKGKNTPFDNFNVSCKPYAVINNNNIFYSEL